MKLRELTGTVQRVEPTRAYIATDTGLEVVRWWGLPSDEADRFAAAMLGMMGRQVWVQGDDLPDHSIGLRILASPPPSIRKHEPDRPRHLRVVE